MKKKIFALLFLIFVVGIAYFLFFKKDKNLKYIPENADVVALIDVKNISRFYIYNLVTNPSEIFKEKGEKTNKIKLKDSGIKIPDFLQVFHLKDSDFSEWYSVIELSDKEKFLEYLKQEKFINQGKDFFRKDKISIKIIGEKCIVKSGKNTTISSGILSGKLKNADDFIENSHGSISFISEGKIKSFPIEIGENFIEIENSINSEKILPFIKNLAQKNNFAEVHLDKNLLKKAEFFHKKFNVDSLEIQSISAISAIEEVNDTIVTYEYDDNFNEIEKKSFQKILQPNYNIYLSTQNTEKTIQFFQNKKWMNEKNEFTAIPFQPNQVFKNGKNVVIQSKKNPIKIDVQQKKNYVFIKNNLKLIHSFSSFNKTEKEKISALQYIFYLNEGDSHYLRIQFNEEKIPLILKF